MALTVYTGALGAEEQGDIVLDPRTRLGSVGTIESTKVEVVSGAELFTWNISADGLMVNVKGVGAAGDAVLNVIADKNLDPAAEDNEVGEFHITFTPAGVATVAMTFANIRPVDEA